MNAQAIKNNYNRSIQTAQDSVHSGQWSDGLETLKSIEKECADKSCRAKVMYTKGYLFEKKYEAEGDIYLLDSAAVYYIRVLYEYPDHIPTILALVNVFEKKDDPESAFSLVVSKVNNNRDYNLSKDKALILYQELVNQLQDQNYYVPFQEKLSYCEMMYNDGFIQLSEQMASSMIKEYYAIDEPNALKSLLWWLKIISEKNNQNYENISALPAEWGHAAVKELKGLSENNFNLPWWQYNKLNEPGYDENLGYSLRPKKLMTDYLLSLAKSSEDQNQTEEAMKYYESAFLFATENANMGMIYGDYIPEEFFTASSAYGIFLTKYENEVDPEDEKFKELERFLFSGKGSAYNNRNKEIIADFHKTLGLIYADRQQWSGGFAKNALYQLKHAIEMSPDQEDKSSLIYIYAEGLDKTGDKKASDWYIRSGYEYLNNGNMIAAENSFTKALNVKGADNNYVKDKINQAYISNILVDYSGLPQKDKNFSQINKNDEILNQQIRAINPVFPERLKRYEELISSMNYDGGIALEEIKTLGVTEADKNFLMGFAYNVNNYFEKSVQKYLLSAELDSSQYETFYNLSVLNYNQSINLSLKANQYIEYKDKNNPDMDQYLNSSLEYIKKAYLLNPENKDVLNLFYSVNKLLNNDDDAGKIKKKIRRDPR